MRYQAAVELTRVQQRTVIALACKVAWADGDVTDDEREVIRAFVERLGGKAVTARELDEWLTRGGPEAELSELPEAITEEFLYEAMRIMRADGEESPAEVDLVCQVMARLFDSQPKGTPLGRVQLVKRPSKP